MDWWILESPSPCHVAITAKSQTGLRRRQRLAKHTSPISSAISMFAPSMVPMMSAPFMANFMFPVPLASVPAVEMCWLQQQDGRTAVGSRRSRSQPAENTKPCNLVLA